MTIARSETTIIMRTKAAEGRELIDVLTMSNREKTKSKEKKE